MNIKRLIKNVILKYLHEAQYYVVRWHEHDEPQYIYQQQVHDNYSDAIAHYHRVSPDKQSIMIYAEREKKANLVLRSYNEK